MIYVKASKMYFLAQFHALLKRLETNIQERASSPFIPLNGVKAEIGRLVYFAGEMLPQESFIDLMSMLSKSLPVNLPEPLTIRDCKNAYLNSIR